MPVNESADLFAITPPENSPSPSKKTLILIIILFILAIGLSGIAFWLYQSRSITLTPTPSPSTAALVSPTPQSSLKSFTQNGLQFSYPPNLEPLVHDKSLSISLRSKTSIREEYEQYRQGEGCLGNCGLFVDNPTLLDRQFALLEELNLQPECVLSPEYIDNLKKEFILFQGGLGQSYEITSLKLNSGICALKFIEYDGYDVDLRNIYYKLGFIQNDQLIRFTATLFPNQGIQSIDRLRQDFGYSQEGACDSACLDRETAYFESFNLHDPAIQEVISIYDQLISTLTLL